MSVADDYDWFQAVLVQPGAIDPRPIRRKTHTVWCVTHKGDRAAWALADRHYTRQTKGATSWTRNGQNLVLVTCDEKAVWNLHRPKPGASMRTDGRDAWECTIFRNEGPYRSSALIRQAVEVCRMVALGAFGCRPGIEDWGSPPETASSRTSIRPRCRRRSQATVSEGLDGFGSVRRRMVNRSCEHHFRS